MFMSSNFALKSRLSISISMVNTMLSLEEEEIKQNLDALRELADNYLTLQKYTEGNYVSRRIRWGVNKDIIECSLDVFVYWLEQEYGKKFSVLDDDIITFYLRIDDGRVYKVDIEKSIMDQTLEEYERLLKIEREEEEKVKAEIERLEAIEADVEQSE